MINPRTQPTETGGSGADALQTAGNDRVRISFYRTTDGNDVAPDVRIGPQFDIPEHRDHIAANRIVNIGIAQDRDRTLSHWTVDPRIPENRHDLAGLSLNARGTENRHHRVGMRAARQVRVIPDD